MAFSLKGRSLKFDSAEEILEHLAAMGVDVEEIDLSGNTFGIEACKALAKSLSSLDKLSTCNMHDMFTGRLRSEIPQSLNYLVESLLDKPVKLLDLSDNAFGPDGIRPLVPLISKLTSLETLKLHNTGLGPQGGQLLAQALRQLAENCGEKESDEDKPSEGPLRRLVVGRSRLENGSMKDLADALAMHPNLEELVLPQNGIRPEGITYLLKALEKCRKLRILDLQDNTFTEKGAIALANAIPHWPLLEQLNVGDCYLTSKGFRHLVPVLRDSAPALKELNLQYNELNVAAMESLLAAVRAMKLKRLEINGNCGGDLVEEFSEVLGDEVLGSVSDMEEEESDEDEDQSEDQSEEESEKEQEEAEIDELGAAMSRVNV